MAQGYYTSAEEGLLDRFKKTPKTVDELLVIAKKNVTKKLKTVEQCDAAMASAKDAAKQVNDNLVRMMKAANDLQGGKVDSKAAKAEINAAAKEMSKMVSALYVKMGAVVPNKNSVTADQIKDVKKYVTGLNALIKARKAELQSAPAKESVDSDAWIDEIMGATESVDMSDAELDAAFESAWDTIADDESALDAAFESAWINPALEGEDCTCPECGAQVPCGAKYCPECGEKLGGEDADDEDDDEGEECLESHTGEYINECLDLMIDM